MMCPVCYVYLPNIKDLISHMEEKESWNKKDIGRRLLAVGVVNENELQQMNENGANNDYSR